jgi:hypothetical protein
LELTTVRTPSDGFDTMTSHEHRTSFGIVLNENRANVAKNRLNAVRDWVLSNWPNCEIHGKWSDVSQRALGRTIETVPPSQLEATLQRWRCTLTTPASGSGWATAKPWECFRAGTICFFHPDYDTQQHILGDAHENLRAWLRVRTPDELATRVAFLDENPAMWGALILEQHRHYVRRFEETHGGVLEIERRLIE